MKKKILNFIKKKNKSKIICLTAYSNSISSILDNYCDLILVGDSLANVLYGDRNTHRISLDTIIKHSISVRRGVKKSLLVVDMPKNTYNSTNQAKKNAKKILKKTKCDAIKIESNKKNFKIIKYLVKSKIPVMGHIGFTPQFSKKFKISGKSISEQKRLINEAKKIQKAGAFSIVLECITANTAKKITNLIKIPTIGIGSSHYCDGQILVTDDLLGLGNFYPKFVKRFANLNNIINRAVKKFKNEVKLERFPSKKYSY